jgi:hypothetical protein
MNPYIGTLEDLLNNHFLSETNRWKISRFYNELIAYGDSLNEPVTNESKGPDVG